MLLLLSSGWAPMVRDHGHEPNLGRLVHPRCMDRVADTAASGMPYAADNDAFSEFEPARYRVMLDKLAPLSPGPLFVTAPDVVGDAAATRRRFDQWIGELERRGLRAAYVLQDGQESVPVPWDRIAAVFIGGSTAFKLGPIAAELVREAKARGLFVHAGRVGGAGRIRYVGSIGADSFDSSKFSRWRHTHLPTGLAQGRAGTQLRLVA